MGFKFIPNELEEKARNLLSFCSEYEIETDFYDLDDESYYEEEDITIKADTGIRIALPRAYDYEDTTVEELDFMVNCALIGEIIEDYKFVSPKLVFIHVECLEKWKIDSFSLSETLIEQNWNGIDIEVNLKKGLTSYGLKLTINNLYDKYMPPVDSEDLFIEIKSKEDLNYEQIDDIAQSYIFECASTLGVNLNIVARANSLEYWDDEDLSKNEKINRLRPLIQGKGIPEVIKLFNVCNEVHNPEYLILTYTKVIEYVSQTVLRKEIVESITKKLYSPKALSPDANYILELEKIYEENRNNKKDSQAIRLTVETCCDLMDIVSLAPKFLKKTKKLTSDSNKEERAKCLEEFATAISDTRNMIAHAKTNYKFKGNECPADELEEFSRCLKVAANQVIRWFSRQHEDSRII